MRLCYIDDSGDTGSLPSQPSLTGGASPHLLLLGVVVHHSQGRDLADGVIDIKSRYLHVRQHAKERLERIDAEVKGADIRKGWRASATANAALQARGTLDEAVNLVERLRCPLIARGYVKRPGASFDGKRLTNLGVLGICEAFHALLERENDVGMVVLDARSPAINRELSHTIFTRKHAAQGGQMPRLVDVPTPAEGRNHAGLQLADWLASAVVAPMIWSRFCRDETACPELDPGYDALGPACRRRLAQLQWASRLEDDGWRGGVFVQDMRGGAPSARLFSPPSQGSLRRLVRRPAKPRQPGTGLTALPGGRVTRSQAKNRPRPPRPPAA